MPYKAFHEGDQWCVHKVDENEQPDGDALGCHETEDAAGEQIKALYASEQEMPVSDALISETIREQRVHTLKGKYPAVPTFSHVDMDLLTQGDDDPFFITLEIARVGEVSANQLIYDEYLVGEIARQLAGSGGIRGHVPDDERGTAFPLEDVDWVGCVREGASLWAKGYIPPGETRNLLRRIKARGGAVATSIYGTGMTVREAGGRRMREGFILEQVDLAPAKRAALKLGTGFGITAEMEQIQEYEMDREQIIAELNVADIPDAIKQAIIQEHDSNREATENIAELRQYAEVMGEVRAVLGEGVDVAETVKMMHMAMSSIADQLGVDMATVAVHVNQLHEAVKEYKQREFEAQLDTAIAELTNWNATSDDGKAKLSGLRQTLRALTLAELAGKQEGVAEAAQKVFEDQRVIAEAVRDALAGPAALISGLYRDKKPVRPTQEEIMAARAKTGI